MTRLKNVTLGSVALQMFETKTPMVNDVAQDIILVLKPGDNVDEALWLESNEHAASYNANIIDNYLQKNILSRIL
ncbi:MAG: hypothetical protein JHC33_05140 [Ignisphaera sp.]|nr:hypothetical protein [Ignisphaera sp.]